MKIDRWPFLIFGIEMLEIDIHLLKAYSSTQVTESEMVIETISLQLKKISSLVIWT